MSNPVVDSLTAQVAATKTVVDSAIVLLNGIQQRITDAVNAALAGGASAADLAPVTDAVAALSAETQSLAAAVANVPA